MRQYTVLGMYDHVDSAASVIGPLGEMDIKHRHIKVLTMAPYPHGTFYKDETPIPIWRFALIGGLAGFVVGIALAGGTQVLMNLIVGGKSPLSLPAVGVLTYEITLLGTVLGTLVALLWMAGLPNWTQRAYDDSISAGSIGVLVSCRDEEHANMIEKTMLRHKAVKIKKGQDDF